MSARILRRLIETIPDARKRPDDRQQERRDPDELEEDQPAAVEVRKRAGKLQPRTSAWHRHCKAESASPCQSLRPAIYARGLNSMRRVWRLSGLRPSMRSSP